MKINELQNAQVLGKNTNTGTKVPGESDFQKILESKQGEASGPTPAGEASQVAQTAVPAALRLESLQLSEQTIDTLESFGSALGNLQFAGKDLEPFVEVLEDNARSILELKKQFPAQDPLVDILDRVATVSYIETAKYRRGDYL